MITSRDTTSSRKVLSSPDEARQAVEDVARSATRSLAIFTHDLEPAIYDQDTFLDIVKHLVLSRSYARIRVLVLDPMRAIKDGNRFVALGRRLNSYIEFRNVHKDYRDHTEAFCIADNTGLVYRLDAARWDGIADTYEPTIAKRYLKFFDDVWNASDIEPEFRELVV